MPSPRTCQAIPPRPCPRHCLPYFLSPGLRPQMIPRPLLLDPSPSWVYSPPHQGPSQQFQYKEAVMSFRKALWALSVVVCLAAPVAVRAQGDYLDVFIVKVKPEKVADFQALTKKWVEANRRFNGDRWLALEAVYGEGNVYQFTSTRKDYADIDKTNEAGMLAVNKAFGKEAAQKIIQD